MKRLFLIFPAILIGVLSFAQTSKQTDFLKLEKKVEKSNTEIANPKKNVVDKTWLTRGDVMAEIQESMLLTTRAGMSDKEFKIIVGDPNEILQEVIDSVDYQVYMMDRIKFYFFKEELIYWVITKPIVEQPLMLSYEAYLKADEIDTKGRLDKSLNEKLIKLKYAFINEATNYYALKDFNNSFEYFKKAIEVGQHPSVNSVDTVLYYYTGLSAQLAKKLEDAISNYQKGLEIGFSNDGAAYYNIYEAYSELGRGEEGLRYLEEGFSKFPNNQNVLYSLINYYLNRGEDPSKVFIYLTKAQEQDPNEPSLYFAEGTLYDKLEKTEEAAASYKKALEIKPDFFDAAYNLGALYYNHGVKFIEEANKVPAKELEKYDSLVEKANIEFKKCIPYMELAHKINPKEPNTLETLKNLYFRYRNDSEEYTQKLKEVNEKIENL